MKKLFLVLIGAVVLICAGAYVLKTLKKTTKTETTTSNTTIQVVAAENFYGDVVKQLGGDHVSVTSILSDPNVDPHEYESNVQDSVALSKANIVIKNGLEYDTWINKLLAASPNQNRIVLSGGDIAPHKLPDNPHVWYGVDNMSAVAAAITDSLKKIDPADVATFDINLKTFQNSLTPLQQKMDEVKTKYNGTPVGLTETIYLYQTEPMGLKVLTPFEFEKAIAEGNDPPASSVKITNDQVNKKQVKILIYNSQTVTPITTNLQNAANQLSIPVIPVSETMPQNKTYQMWMMDQLTAVEKALQ